jgi:hypothetical protein
MLFNGDDQTKQDDEPPVVSQSVAQTENKNDNKPTEIVPTALIDAPSCNIDDLSEEDLKLRKVITDLPSLSDCLKLSEEIQNRLLKNMRLSRLIYTDNSSFNILSTPLSDHEWRITSFKNLISNIDLDGMLFMNKAGETDFDSTDLSIGVSFQEAKPQLFCKNAFPDWTERTEISFYYFTTAENDYRKVYRFFAHGVLLLIERIYKNIRDNKVGEDNDSAIALGKIQKNISQGATPSLERYPTTDNQLSDNSCIITIDKEDAYALQRKLNEKEKDIKMLSIDTFMEAQLSQYELRTEVKSEIPELGCHNLPELFVFSNEVSSSKYVIEDVLWGEGNSNPDRTFHFWPKIATLYSPEYQLPQSVRFSETTVFFDNLRDAYSDKIDRTPFSEDGYDPLELCFTR